jgi:hypothetical protein
VFLARLIRLFVASNELVIGFLHARRQTCEDSFVVRDCFREGGNSFMGAWVGHLEQFGELLSGSLALATAKRAAVACLQMGDVRFPSGRSPDEVCSMQRRTRKLAVVCKAFT